MSSFSLPERTALALIAAIDSGEATAVAAATFRHGEEGEILTRCYRWAGEVYRTVYNGRTTVTTCFSCEGEDRELFDIFYPPGESREAVHFSPEPVSLC